MFEWHFNRFCIQWTSYSVPECRSYHTRKLCVWVFPHTMVRCTLYAESSLYIWKTWIYKKAWCVAAFVPQLNENLIKFFQLQFTREFMMIFFCFNIGKECNQEGVSFETFSWLLRFLSSVVKLLGSHAMLLSVISHFHSYDSQSSVG